VVGSQVGFVEIFVLLHDDMQPTITVTSKQQHVYIVRCSRSVSCVPRVEVLCLCVCLVCFRRERGMNGGRQSSTGLDFCGMTWQRT
jgi:hypothetical protein